MALFKMLPPKLTKAQRARIAKARKKEARAQEKQYREDRKNGCSCWPNRVGAGMEADPRCPVHGLSAYRFDRDRR